jgi:hypothetical protein
MDEVHKPIGSLFHLPVVSLITKKEQVMTLYQLISCNLFKGVISNLGFIASTDWMTVNTELQIVEGSGRGLI